MRIEIMDTTLRDGEQTSGVSFTATEKLTIARLLLEEMKLDRLEVASAKVSEGEFRAVKMITEWATKAGYLDRIEVLGFIDGTQSIDWIVESGAKVVNLLSKGSLKHVTSQLRKTPEQHLADVKKAIAYAKSKGLTVNLYLEDWSNGMRNSPDYVYFLLDNLKDEPVRRFMLPDTLGILNHEEVYAFLKPTIERYPHLHFDFHAHNDYDLSIANIYASVKAGVQGVHTTVNGLGERAGNNPLSSTIAVLRDHLKVETGIVESKITKVSRLVETFSGVRVPSNKPIIGENVFTQTCGVHADGDNKDNLYYNDLLPERFGRVRKYALGKTAGKSNILKNLEEIGIELDADAMKRVTQRVIELGDQKETVTTDDLPYIISDVLKSRNIEEKIKVKNYSLSLAMGLKPVATIAIEINNKIYQESSPGDGQYDAVMKALVKIYDQLGKKLPRLLDYAVTIPPGGKTDALVQTTITWENSREFKTRGLDSDQNVAAIKATVKMLNIIENE